MTFALGKCDIKSPKCPRTYCTSQRQSSCWDQLQRSSFLTSWTEFSSTSCSVVLQNGQSKRKVNTRVQHTVRRSGQQGEMLVRVEAATHARVGVLVAVDVEDRQNVNVHLVEQAGHLSVAAIGRQSLRTKVETSAMGEEAAPLVHRCVSPL